MLRSLMCLVCVLVIFSGCKKAPKKLAYGGKEFHQLINRRAFGYKMYLYYPEGQNQIDAKESLHVLEYDGSTKLTPQNIGLLKSAFLRRVKLIDKDHTIDKSKEMFCYRQNLGQKRMLVFSKYLFKRGKLNILQYVQVLEESSYQDSTAELCQRSDSVFSGLAEVAANF